MENSPCPSPPLCAPQTPSPLHTSGRENPPEPPESSETGQGPCDVPDSGTTPLVGFSEEGPLGGVLWSLGQAPPALGRAAGSRAERKPTPHGAAWLGSRGATLGALRLPRRGRESLLPQWWERWGTPRAAGGGGGGTGRWAWVTGAHTTSGPGPGTPAPSRVQCPPGRSPHARQSLFSGKASSEGPARLLGRVARRPGCAKLPSRAKPPGGPAGAGTVGP